MLSKFASLLALGAATVTAKTISIDVADGSLTFKPNTTTADVGDILEFHFYDTFAPHSVVQGTFSSPCTPAEGAFFSDYINGTSTGSDVYSIMVTSTDPIWFYCSARMHCESGMVGVVNPPSNETIEMFATSAQSAASNVAPGSTMVSGSYTTMPASMTGASSSMSSSPSATTSAPTSSTPSMTSSAAAASSTPTGAGAMKTAGVMGMMAAGGLAALLI